MRRVLIALLLALLGLLPIQAADVLYLWPIAGADAGTSILSAPQSYLGKELNFDGLFLGAPEGTPVLAPVDGKILFISLSYLSSLTYSSSFGNCEGLSFDEALNDAKKEIPKQWDSRYVSGSISIQTKDGKHLHIGGLRGSSVFKTGQRIHRGDTLGVVAYSYRKLREPHIQLSMSKHAKPVDPMIPFGLKTTFIPPKKEKRSSAFTQAQAQEDVRIARDAITRLYPSFYAVVDTADYMAWKKQTNEVLQQTGDRVSYATLRKQIGKLYYLAHDSHLYMYPDPEKARKRYYYQPALFLGWINDTLRCTRTSSKHRSRYGQEIIAVDGYSADEFKQKVMQRIENYDLHSESYLNRMLATTAFGYGLKDKKKFNMQVTFANGEKRQLAGLDIRRNRKPYEQDWSMFFRINRYGKENYKLQQLNDSVAYIGLSTFELNQVEVDEIVHFIDSVKAMPYLILDTRNNYGGHDEVVHQLYSHLSNRPLRTKAYARMNVTGNDSLFNYTLNMRADSANFTNYLPLKGKTGYYEQPLKGYHEWLPDSTLHYTGRIYALINERSASAAMLLPAMLMRARRAVVVGRESNTGYHFMTALKFADVSLPHSRIALRIPLVQLYFDGLVTKRTPKGRGLLPDYEVPITLADLTNERGDAILNEALALIEKGDYLSSKNPFAEEDKRLFQENLVETAAPMNYLWWLLLSAVTLVFVIMIFKRKK